MKKHLVLLAFFIFIFFTSFSLYAVPAPRETIERFDAFATVYPDASVQITERIVVRSAGEQIKKGIFRVLPLKGVEGYDVLSVRRNGQPEPYEVKSSRSDKKIYIGAADVFIAPGQHVYEISYRVKGAVGFEKEFDELYWNVTGNDWIFPIESASLRLALPPGAQIAPDGISLYTGRSGQTGPGAARSSGDSFFYTTRPLAAGEGFTVSAAWNKGVVKEPSRAEQTAAGLKQHARSIVLFGLAWLVLLVYYAWGWNRVGRDPKQRVIRRFEPPTGLSPAQVRYVRQMKWDGQMMPIVVMSLVQKGVLSVQRADSDRFTLTRIEPSMPQLLPAEEQAFMNTLFDGRETIVLSNTYAKVFERALLATQYALKKWEKGRYFSRNGWYNLPTWLFGGVLAAALFDMSFFAGHMSTFSIVLFLFVWSWGMLGGFINRFFSNSVRWYRVGLAVLFFLLLPIVLGFTNAMLLFILLLPGIIFYDLVRAYTVLGRQNMDEIEGFLQYLKVAETYRVFESDPTDAGRIYCDYLPYAVALNVQNKWQKTFEREMGEIEADQAARSRGFGFTHGRGIRLFGAALAAAAVSPSSTSGGRSSSGFRGGGSSGGGRGGGGGGGW